MSQEHINRIKQAIAESQSKLNKELSYMDYNQDKKMIAFYESHIAKLNGMLA